RKSVAELKAQVTPGEVTFGFPVTTHARAWPNRRKSYAVIRHAWRQGAPRSSERGRIEVGTWGSDREPDRPGHHARRSVAELKRESISGTPKGQIRSPRSPERGRIEARPASRSAGR